MNLRRLAAFALLAVTPAALAAQRADVQAQLEARGLPAELVQRVVAIAADATARGLPAAALADKAVEGFAKGVPAPRILSALEQFAGRMGQGQEAVRGAGVSAPPGDLVVAAAEALGRGLSEAQVRDVVRASPAVPQAVPGLLVAAALSAQGLGVEQSVEVVVDALHAGRTSAQLLDIPSMAGAMRSRGMSPPDIGRELMRGGRGAGPPGPGGDRPGVRPDGPGARPNMPPNRPGGDRPGPGGMRPSDPPPPRP